MVTPDGTRVWVDGGNAVCIYTIDIDSNTLGSFTSDDLAVPTSIAFSPDGDLAYVTDLQNKTVVEFDLTGVEQGVVDLSYGPTWCRVNASTGALYTDRPYEVLSDIPAIFPIYRAIKRRRYCGHVRDTLIFRGNQERQVSLRALCPFNDNGDREHRRDV